MTISLHLAASARTTIEFVESLWPLPQGVQQCLVPCELQHAAAFVGALALAITTFGILCVARQFFFCFTFLNLR